MGEQKLQAVLLSLLLCNTNGTTMTSGGLCVLTTDTEAPRVAETTVDANLLEVFKILTEFVVEVVRKKLAVGTVLEILLTIEEPGGDLVGGRVLHDGDDALHLISVEFSSTLAHVDLGDLKSKIGEASAKTLDDSQCEGSLVSSVDVSVLHTQDVLEISSILEDKS